MFLVVWVACFYNAATFLVVLNNNPSPPLPITPRNHCALCRLPENCAVLFFFCNMRCMVLRYVDCTLIAAFKTFLERGVDDEFV